LLAGTETYDFTPPTPFALEAGSTYWVVATNATPVAHSYLWVASSPGVTPTGVATRAGFRRDFGPPPPVTGSAPLTPDAVPATPAGAVPERSAWLLLGLSLLGVFARAGRWGRIEG